MPLEPTADEQVTITSFSKAGHSPSICSNSFGGHLSRVFPFSAHQIWWIIHRSDRANCKPVTYGQPDSQGYQTPPLPLR
ncbi:hypothetical protein AVEN_74247-1 [Araneus ventricosus]|uniref:Uncharacterized protein n=1 Tax=Araneus ventricosus TaxID=182803 RepID=A0A4Y2EUG5_ARAVE|nr:hypothetical protein AVEN_74247-1 [Araneus ventricosus]